MTAAAPASPPGPENPFQYGRFRSLMTALLCNHISIWVQSVGAALLMTTLTTSPLMTALVQSAVSLPSFLLGAHAGALADIADRRRILIVTQSWLIAIALLLFTFAALDWLSPWSLLFLTFALGAGFAVGNPAWNTSVPDSVGPAAKLQAISFTAVSYNAARAVGPAIAGIIVAIGGVSSVFAVNAAVAIVVMSLVWRRLPADVPSSGAREKVWGALLGGFRYVRHSPPLHGYLQRTVAFSLCASALWALLPVVARQTTGSSAGTASIYAWMLGSLGLGAVAGGLSLRRIRNRLPLPKLMSISATAFALVMLVTALVHTLWIVCAGLFIGGVAWMGYNSTITAAFHTTLPSWVRSRVLAVQMLVFQGSMAFGSFLWGSVASGLSVPIALIAAAVLTAAGMLITSRSPLRLGEESEIELATALPELTVVEPPPPGIGPVAIEIEYSVEPASREAFLRAVHEIGKRRRRDGARSWRLYRDLNDSNRLAERFIVDSWEDYLRQRSRSTVADRTAEEALIDFLTERTAPRFAHYIDEPRPAASGAPQDEPT